jgi:predicted DNA-binding transcriptional regulator AlpA
VGGGEGGKVNINKGRQAAEKIGISVRQMYQLIKEKKLPPPPRKKINGRPEWDKQWIREACTIVHTCEH